MVASGVVSVYDEAPRRCGARTSTCGGVLPQHRDISLVDRAVAELALLEYAETTTMASLGDRA